MTPDEVSKRTLANMEIAVPCGIDVTGAADAKPLESK
jgi:hypothetical protein